MVTIDKLTRHFSSRHRQRPQIIGLHAKSREDTCLWMGIDIDMHDVDKVGADEHARRNLVGAINWWRQLQSLGYDPLLFDSNGYGGYHLWVLFDEPAPADNVFAFAWSIVSTWEENNLSEEPETFPKKFKPDSLGPWFRLPGLHHTRDHYATVWSGDEWLDDPWLSGHAAIDAMLQCVPGPPPPEITAPTDHSRTTIRSKKATATKKPPRASDRKRQFKRSARPTVCVDLDGVLAHRQPGLDAIGEPVDGAIEFCQRLSENADVVILTARLAQDKPDNKRRRATLKMIETWLEQHGIVYHRIHDGYGKPPALAYIDDRAVPCQPLEQGIAAFDTAVTAVERLS
jgi:hypothetical protein